MEVKWTSSEWVKRLNGEETREQHALGAKISSDERIIATIDSGNFLFALWISNLKFGKWNKKHITYYESNDLYSDFKLKSIFLTTKYL